MANVNVTIRMDENMKRQADKLFSDLGLTLSSAITVFIKQAIREQAIPFTISREIPNRETLEAMEEVRLLKINPNKKAYNSFEELIEDIENE